MLENRVVIRPDDILYIEVVCANCKDITVFPLAPPSQAPDEPEWHKHLCQCLWCRGKLPLGLKGIVLELQKHFTTLRGHPELGLRFVTNVPREQ